MKVLVVDDDRVVADLVAFTVRRAGYEAVLASDAASTLRRWREDQPDLIILDINLPGTAQLKDGIAICQHIRSQSDVPIILLTVRGEENDIVHGLEAGADDYVLKPFSPRQLVARVQAVMRRGRGIESSSHLTKLSVDGLEFNPKIREVYLSNGITKSLTSLESRLLEYLMLNAGHVLTTEAIITHIWGTDEGDRDALRQLIRRLRSKIEPDPAQPAYIETIPSLGYGFINPTD